METSCSVTPQNTVGWESGDGALLSSVMGAGICLRVRGGLILYTDNFMVNTGLLCLKCGFLTLRIQPWMRCVDCDCGYSGIYTRWQ